MDKFNISFSGEILAGHELEQVQRRFAKAFHLEELDRTEAFFSGQKIILRRNLDKEEAARIFAGLRKMGLDIHIEKVIPPEQAPQEKPDPTSAPAPAEKAPTKKAMPKAEPAPAPKPKRNRQPGAPNLFDLQLSDRAGADHPHDEVSGTLIKIPLFAAALVMMAFVLVSLRFLAQVQPEVAEGLGYIAVDPRQQLVVQAGESLLFHDRAGRLLETEEDPVQGMRPHSPFAFFSNGDMLLLRDEIPQENSRWGLPTLGENTVTRPALSRCTPGGTCTDLLEEVGNISFTLDTRNDIIFLADSDADSLTKLNSSGMVLASARMELSPPVHLALEEGILYLTQANSDSVQVLKPDDQDFALELDRIALNVEQSSQSGHIYPGDLAWLNGSWWVIMQSRDGGTSGLYQFDPRWQYQAYLPLPSRSRPQRLTRWDTRMLVSDLENRAIYRLDAAARPEQDFSSEALLAALGSQEQELSLSRSLQGLVLLILFVTSAGLLAFGILQTLRGKVYVPPADHEEQGFDINNADIYWLDPDPMAPARMRQLGCAMAGLAFLVLLGGFLLHLSIWFMLAIIILFAGLGGLYFSVLRSSHCHLGTLDGRLILVDHNNTYRVGSDATIQYFSNYVMIDDVIVYLGNRLLRHFANTPLQQTFNPLVSRGIKIDRTTLRVKLIQARHPMWQGSGGLALAILLAFALLLAG